VNVPPVRAHITLESISLVESVEGTSVSGPIQSGTQFRIYLWTVFCNVDVDTVFVDKNFSLQGTATLVATPGNHDDLPAVGPVAGIDDCMQLKV
jgi:hypothetical protein